jgi:hypothetical protein
MEKNKKKIHKKQLMEPKEKMKGGWRGFLAKMCSL